MKKFFAIIAAVFIMVVSFALPISVYADDSYYHIDTGNDPFRYPNDFYTISDFYDMTSGSYAVGSDLQNKGHFLRLLFDSDRSGTRGTAHGFMFVYGDDVSVEYDSDFNVLTLTGINNSNDQPIKGYYERSSDCQNASRTATIRSKCDCYKLEIDFNSSISTLYYSGGSRSLDYYCTSSLSNPGNIFYSEAILDVPPVDPNALNVSVWFTPSLVGEVDRSINGSVSENFDIHITNNSLFGVQVLMAIVPHGGVINFYDNSDPLQDSDVSGVVNPNSSSYNFIWWSDETNYNYESTIQTSSPHTHHPVFSETFLATKQISPSPWHYVSAQRSDYVHGFSWKQVPLEKYGSYDVLVYALRNDYGFASRQAAFPDADYFVDYSEIQLIYSSNFILTNDYIVDLNDSSFGNYVVNTPGMLSVLGLSSKGYIDSEGNAHIDIKKIDDFLDKHKQIMASWQDAYSKPKYTGNSSSSFSSVTSLISPFMLFLKTGFSFFPDTLQSIFYIGFLAVITLAVFKVVVH